MGTTPGGWSCPHLDPEEWDLIQRSLVFAVKYANRDPQTRADLEALHDRVDAIRSRNLRRRTSAREASRRIRARRRDQAQRVESVA